MVRGSSSVATVVRQKNMRILGLIPARGGSKGIPRKNIKLLDGKELIRYSIEIGLRCEGLDEIMVSTEDEEIAKISKAAGASIPYLRPENLADDKSPTIETVIHVLNYYEKQGNPFDAICLLQPTVPFRNLGDLNLVIQKFKETEADSLISVRAVPHIYNPHWVYEEDSETGFLKMAKGGDTIIPRRQDLPKAYHRDGSIYLTKKEIILKEKSLYGKKIIHHVMKNSPNINIDTMEDWEAAVKFAQSNFEI